MKIEQKRLNRSPLPHAIIGFDGTIASVNDAWADFFVTRPKNCVSELLYRLVDPVDRTDLLAAWETLEPREETITRELRPGRGKHQGEPLVWLFKTSAGSDHVVATIVVNDVHAGFEPDADSRPEIDTEPLPHVVRNQYLIAALDDLGNGLAVFENEQIVWANDAMLRIFGYTLEELIGCDGYNLVAEHDRPFVMKRRRERLAGKNPQNHYQIDGRRKDGSVIRVEMSVQMFGDGPDAVIVVRDITEQTRQGERIQRAEKMQSLGELAASLGREYNNMVMAYSLLTDALRDRLGDDAPHELDRLDEVNRGALNLTRRLLTLEGRPLSQPAPTDVNVSAWEAIENCAHLGVEIVPRLTPGLPNLTVDRDQLEVVLMELIENAAAASHEDGLVLVETDQRIVSEHDELDHILHEGHYVVLRVVDDGDGIAEEVLEHVVEPFFTTRPLDATGLGLTAAYSIVRGLGGHLAVHSRDRVGTRVEVFLPATSAGKPIAPPKARQMLPEEVRVILVDSSDVLRELLTDGLERMGHEVTSFATPAEAFASIQSGNGCDVIVAELVSVGSNAFDFVRRLRGEALDVCVVLTSGRQALPASTLNDQIPNLGFLHKPFTAERLAAEIRSVLEARTKFV